jgi:hypothetical protein
MLERRAGEIREKLVSMNAQEFLHEPAVGADPVHGIGETEAGPRHLRGTVGIAEKPIAQLGAFSTCLHRIVTVNESRKIELELVVVARRVGALDFTEFALKTGIHHPFRILRPDATNVAVVLFV